jgi:hypothetical protein
MAYVKAQQEKWSLDELKFNVVGDVYGGIWALNNGEAQGFLWEKFTTSPFVDQGKCRLLDEVLTPWPCFVIAVRSELVHSDEALLREMVSVVQKEAYRLKHQSNPAEQFAWRYALPQKEVQKWLNQTEWNYGKELAHQDFEMVVSELLDLGLLTENQALNWEEKLF